MLKQEIKEKEERLTEMSQEVKKNQLQAKKEK